ncbi:acyl-CoA dehydrogenase family protein [Phenylobacterium sp.]|uniref:acyl-CoA dehydrogenase family protein n=1 Tax=Phenylobacterium sp. TaxID=1871053 RepID=UPI002734084C|nr:acyl-CoA dehydrogenase family protein [Phenylobacterium sp.]MDP3855492.1 acyl-CoA dehydrogenase family protein [Phenylobacterium sp.]
MHVAWSPEDLAFRDEVRAFLDAELTPAMRRETQLMTSVYAPHELSMSWQAILHARGWAAPAWPVEHGGCGWTAAQRYIFASEMAAAGAPPLSPMGIGMCGPVLIGHGTPEQKAFYLPRMLTGEHHWCQGYSEPGSGSDLASLQMAAVDDGDHFVCTGHKLWTTHANISNWIFCLVRTSQERIPQQGITFLLIDMATPGIEVRPILMLSGEHIQNDVFFTEVRVPKANVVGKVGEGWTVAKYLMEFERGGGVSTPGLKSRLGRVRDLADREGVLAHPGFASRLAQLSVEIDALAAVELQILANLSQGDAPGAKSSMMKTVGTELSQRLTELALEAAGDYAAAYQPHATAPGGPTPNFRPPAEQGHVGPDHSLTVASKYLNDRAASIYAGTNEIQRNIIAKAVLGL